MTIVRPRRVRQQLARVIYDAATTTPSGVSALDAAIGIVAWWRKFELPPDQITVDMAASLIGFSWPPSLEYAFDSKLFRAARYARKPYLQGRVGAGAVVFRPGAPSSAPNVFSDWAKLQNALAKQPGPKTIQFDDRLAPIVIPPGVHDMNDVAWESNGGPVPTVIVSAGGTLKNLRRLEGVSVTNNGHDAAFHVDDGEFEIIMTPGMVIK
jgi:hypothetical protein